MFGLVGNVKPYAWGKPGRRSAVASLLESSTYAAASRFVADERTPYAELWMGDHVDGPATVVLADGTTEDVRVCAQRAGIEMPYLFKVLSVNVALSLQAHPDKARAERLHAAFPSIYTDDNHKPEMVVPLNAFEALCMFRPNDELSQVLQLLPEIADACRAGAPDVDAWVAGVREGRDVQANLRLIFVALMRADAGVVTECVRRAVARLQPPPAGRPDMAGGAHASVAEQVTYLVHKLQQQHPDDVGVLAASFLRYVQLSPGQAMFLPANEPHAYLSGDMLEAMARSNNVVRCGLTPKLRDADTLAELLDFVGKPPMVFGSAEPAATAAGPCTFRPPTSEFQVVCVPRGARVIVRRAPVVGIVVSHVGDAAAAPAPVELRFAPAAGLPEAFSHTSVTQLSAQQGTSFVLLHTGELSVLHGGSAASSERCVYLCAPNGSAADVEVVMERV